MELNTFQRDGIITAQVYALQIAKPSQSARRLLYMGVEFKHLDLQLVRDIFKTANIHI